MTVLNEFVTAAVKIVMNTVGDIFLKKEVALVVLTLKRFFGRKGHYCGMIFQFITFWNVRLTKRAMVRAENHIKIENIYSLRYNQVV